ncbi:hypothetical protein BC826DRAFT_621032 [Russula brevipes]|nr:hypothetical protein BC826DRAFT_621032 [Russula brevipes]
MTGCKETRPPPHRISLSYGQVCIEGTRATATLTLDQSQIFINANAAQKVATSMVYCRTDADQMTITSSQRFRGDFFPQWSGDQTPCVILPTNQLLAIEITEAPRHMSSGLSVNCPDDVIHSAFVTLLRCVSATMRRPTSRTNHQCLHPNWYAQRQCPQAPPKHESTLWRDVVERFRPKASLRIFTPCHVLVHSARVRA